LLACTPETGDAKAFNFAGHIAGNISHPIIRRTPNYGRTRQQPLISAQRFWLKKSTDFGGNGYVLYAPAVTGEGLTTSRSNRTRALCKVNWRYFGPGYLAQLGILGQHFASPLPLMDLPQNGKINFLGCFHISQKMLSNIAGTSIAHAPCGHIRY